MTFENLVAPRTARMGTSAIREILKVVSQPGMISLAGGIPAPQSFPLDLIRPLVDSALTRYGHRALQYDLSEGFPPLQEALADYLRRHHTITAAGDEILVSSGSQGVLDAIGKVLIGPGDAVAVEAPTYLGALQAFTPYEPAYVQIESDDDGVIPASLEVALAVKRVKFVYLVPTFQNPTGRTIPLARRIEIADMLRRHRALLVEDDPYSLLRYDGDPLPPIHSLAPENVVYVGTLSKVLAPGLRIGFCVAPPAIRKWLVVVKQGVDLHTSTFNQALAAEYLTGGHLERHLPTIVNFYRPRLSAMLQALAACMPSGFRWSMPNGGMFVWIEGPPALDMTSVYQKAVASGVAFVPGTYFHAAPGAGTQTARLNFTMADEATIAEGIARLAILCQS
ncbi:MAG: PLP-dependent aminotransferase family protein [Pseudomonadota bacterium]